MFYPRALFHMFFTMSFFHVRCSKMHPREVQTMDCDATVLSPRPKVTLETKPNKDSGLNETCPWRHVGKYSLTLNLGTWFANTCRSTVAQCCTCCSKQNEALSFGQYGMVWCDTRRQGPLSWPLNMQSMKWKCHRIKAIAATNMKSIQSKKMLHRPETQW